MSTSPEPSRREARRNPRINSECPSCGEVEFAPERGWLVEMSVAELSYFSFSCPKCELVVRRPASAQARAVLRRWVATEFLQVPQEALEARPTTPLTVDEVLDILLAMRDVQVFTPEAAAPSASVAPSQPV